MLEEAKFFGITKVIEQLEVVVEVGGTDCCSLHSCSPQVLQFFCVLHNMARNVFSCHVTGISYLSVCVRCVCVQAEKLSQAGRLSRKEFIQMIGCTSSPSVLRCQGLDLRAMDLSHLDLQSVNFSHADLRQCNLVGANLSNCCMEYANLEGGTLDVSGVMAQVAMNVVMVCNVNCSSWQLCCNTANWLCLQWSSCVGVVICSSLLMLKGAILQCVDLSKTKLDHASLKGCNFDKRLDAVTHMVGEWR